MRKVKQVLAFHFEQGRSQRVCLRGDTHFSLTAHLDEWSEKADFIVGCRSCPTLELAVGP